MSRARSRAWVGAILLAAAGARLALALLGGQHHYGDEIRYYRAAAAWLEAPAVERALWHDTGAIAAHAGFTVVAAALLPVHAALARWAEPGAATTLVAMWHTPQLAAALLGLFSTLNLWLLYRIARQAGADEEEARWVLLLAASSLTLFVYSRHLLPYDPSLTFFLAATWLALAPRTFARAFAGGAAAGFGYAVYNGYWYLVPVVAVLAAAIGRHDPARVRLGIGWTGGLLAGLALGHLPLVAAGGEWTSAIGTFAGSIRDGDFAEGWRVPFAFLWHAENMLGVATAALAAGAALRPGAASRTRVAALVALALYGLLVLASVGLEQFVVYARTTRPLVPCLCLAAGAGLAALLRPRPQWRGPVAALLVVTAALNFAPLFVQRYPMDMDREIQRQVGVPVNYLTFLGTWDKRLHPPVSRPDLIVVNTYPLFGFEAHRAYPQGEVLLDLPHPMALEFYQYDGLTPAQRALVRQHPPRMQLIRRPRPDAHAP